MKYCILLVLGALLAGTPARAQAVPECGVPGSLLPMEARFPAVARSLKAGKPVVVVAIGGASTLGDAAGDPEKTYPRRLEAALRDRLPGATIRVVNRGRARQTAREMVARFDRDVLAENPDLVIWESGTNEAVRGIEPPEFEAVLQAGIEKLRGRGIDVLLMDMQFGRGSSALLPFDSYLESIRKVADSSEVPLFRRWDIMKLWAETGVFDYEELSRRDRPREVVAAVYNCLAQRLAGVIRRAAS